MYATEADVVACYRLFLGREPDAEGFKNFRALVASGRHPLDDLVALFLSSSEYQRKEAARRQRGVAAGRAGWSHPDRTRGPAGPTGRSGSHPGRGLRRRRRPASATPPPG